MGTLSKRELDALVEEAIVDAYDEYEQTTGFTVMIGDNVDFPFKTVIFGVEVNVTGVDEGPGPGIAAVKAVVARSGNSSGSWTCHCRRHPQPGRSGSRHTATGSQGRRR